MMRRGLRALARIALAGLIACAADADTPDPIDLDGIADALPPVIGAPSADLVDPEETLLDIALRYRLGFDQLVRANPDVPVWIPHAGTRVRLPTEIVLPDVPPEGLVINLPEMRLYDFTIGERPEVIAVAIGDAEDPTPVGEFQIGTKRKDPYWNVPESILEEKPHLPPVVPPGPENPLGSHWMTLGRSSYGIHGTNNRWSIGRTATHGCVRLYETEMEALFARTPEGTRVQLIYEVVKIGQRAGRIYLEAHPDVYARVADPAGEAMAKLVALGLAPYVDESLVRATVERASGLPVLLVDLARAARSATAQTLAPEPGTPAGGIVILPSPGAVLPKGDSARD